MKSARFFVVALVALSALPLENVGAQFEILGPTPLTTPPSKPGKVTIKEEKFSGIVRVRLDSDGFVRIEHDAGVSKFKLQEVPADFIQAWGVIEDVTAPKRIFHTFQLSEKLPRQPEANIKTTFGAPAAGEIVCQGMECNIHRNVKIYDPFAREQLDVLAVNYTREEPRKVRAVHFGKQTESGLVRINQHEQPAQRSYALYAAGDKLPSYQFSYQVKSNDDGKFGLQLDCMRINVTGFNSMAVAFDETQLLELRKIFIMGKAWVGIASLNGQKDFTKDLGEITAAGQKTVFSMDHVSKPPGSSILLKRAKGDKVERFEIPETCLDEVLMLLSTSEEMLEEAKVYGDRLFPKIPGLK